MKKKIVIWMCMGLLTSPLQAQDKFSTVLSRAEQQSPYEAIYTWMDYQAWFPNNAAVYFHLGNLHYDLLPTRDPLHHYPELRTLLYQARLYYGNCLHFAKDQKLSGAQYASIANGQKKIEYAQLVQFVTPRLVEVQRQQSACDSIHNSFCRMADRYNRCQALFSTFLGQYTREKTAHLQLQEEERNMLVRLQKAADSLDADIKAFQKALMLQPIQGYEPVFRKEEIVLYRLDGLTHTDFLQNDIPLWNYSQWVSRFLEEQSTVYERLYSDLDKEVQQLSAQLDRYQVGRPISGQTDESLTGRCKRLGLQNGKVDLVQVMQEQVQHCYAAQTIAQAKAPQSIREFIPMLQVAAQNYSSEPDSAQRQIIAELVQMATPLSIQQQAVYIHPVTGEAIRYTPAEDEKVLCLIPDNKGFRCVVYSEEETRVLYLFRDLSEQRAAKRIAGEKPLIYSKIPGNKWVLITNKNYYVEDL